MTAGPNADAIGQADLADLLGVGARHVRELESEGVLSRLDSKPVRYSRRDAVRAYCEHIRKRASRGVTLTDDSAVEQRRERTRLAREQADKLALANAAARRDLIPAREVEAEWSTILREVRAGVLATASRVALALPHLTTADVAAIDRAIRDALLELTEDSHANQTH